MNWTDFYEQIILSEEKTKGEMSNEWILVENVAPKKGVPVLACRGRQMNVVRFKNKRSGWVSPGRMFEYGFYCFTHWMPLPQPPKK